jgi:glycogen debranching enzyme
MIAYPRATVPRHEESPRLSRRRPGRGCLTVSLLVAVSATVLEFGGSSAQAAVTRPTLTFAKAGPQSTLGAAYGKALKNLLDINTVRYDPDVYNQTGLLTDPPGTFIRAGGGYQQPWARDASVNSWNAASLLEPEVARNTLWSVVRRQANGQLIVEQDNQWWDQVVWLTSAWNHYLVTGDRSFLTDAYQTATNTLNLRRSANYNATYGLFQGPSFFNDGIAGYPVPPADTTDSRGSFVGDYPTTDKMMSLSTNALYYTAYRGAAQMASALGRPATEVSALNANADSLKTKINQHFWIASKGTYGYFIHNGDSLSGTLDQSEEGAGLSLAILFDIADGTQARSIMQNTHVQPQGIVDVYPHFARYGDAKPGRHNVIVWPMVQGFWASAAAHSGDQSRFATEVATLASLANSSDGFYEIYNAQTGEVDGGWQTGGHWGSVENQTWSATAFLRMIYSGLFGMTYTTGGINFTPTLPSGWGDVTLSGVRYRDATLNITLRGSGNVISSFTLDGAATDNHSVPTTLTGTHTVEITLTNGEPSTTLQAENAVLTGGAKANNDHAGYTGTGFVDGYWNQGATTEFTINTTSAGQYKVALRYANATGSAKTLSVFVNGVRVRQTSLPALPDWDTWSTRSETLSLNAGRNTVAYRFYAGDSGNVNLDAITTSGPGTGSNLALNKPATGSMSCNAMEGPEKAVNGGVSGGNSDKWCSAASTRFLQVDLGREYAIGSFTVYHAGAGGEPTGWNTRDFDLLVSKDAGTWHTVASPRGNTANATTHPLAAPVNGRYVRLNVITPTSTTDTTARIYELEVYA